MIYAGKRPAEALQDHWGRRELPSSSSEQTELENPPLKRPWLGIPEASSLKIASGSRSNPKPCSDQRETGLQPPSITPNFGEYPVALPSHGFGHRPQQIPGRFLASSPLTPTPSHRHTITLSINPLGIRPVGSKIVAGAEEKGASDKAKLKKTKAVNEIIKNLGDTCAVCWIVYDKRIPLHSPGVDVVGGCHVPFRDCGLDIQVTAVDYSDWRALIKLAASFRYCYSCGMPQSHQGNKQEPWCHAHWNEEKGYGKASQSPAQPLQPRRRETPPSCPWKDFIFQCLFMLYHNPPVMKQLQQQFEFPEGMALEAWAEWVSIDLTDQGEYWKGLEVFIYHKDIR